MTRSLLEVSRTPLENRHGSSLDEHRSSTFQHMEVIEGLGPVNLTAQVRTVILVISTGTNMRSTLTINILSFTFRRAGVSLGLRMFAQTGWDRLDGGMFCAN